MCDAFELRRAAAGMGEDQYDLGVLFRCTAVDRFLSMREEFEMRVGLDSPARIIRSATATNAELLMQEGKLGVIAPGAYADLLVVDGDPLADLRVLTDPQRNLKVIMKDGVLYKNELG